MTLEEMIAVLNKRGYLLTELYQRREAEWFAAVRRTGDFSSAHGEGSTPHVALERAAARIKPAMNSTDWGKLKVRRGNEPRYRMKGPQ